MNWKVILVLLVCTVLYLLLGGVAFHFMEQPYETNNQQNALLANKAFLSKFTCVDPAQFKKLVQTVIEAYNRGIIAGNESVESESNWDFISSVFFSTTVVTTIGYGHISPSTGGGRVFCVFYALIGIPLAAALLAGIGENIAGAVKSRYKPKNKTTRCAKSSCVWLFLSFILVGGTIFIFLPSVLFTFMEQWTYGESIYYSVVTLTTIGFGDFVAGLKSSGSQRIWYRLLISIWIPIGLSWCALLIGESTDIVKSVFNKPKKVNADGEEPVSNQTKGNSNGGTMRDGTELQDVK